MESLNPTSYYEDIQDPYNKLHDVEPDVVVTDTGETVNRDPSDGYVLGWE